jgi:uncharacterized membrane protein YgdD (TMEM256/DUF423 family)
MRVSPRTWIVLGAVFGALAVGTGAFGAHGLKDRLAASGRGDVYETAARYQMYHAMALVLVGLLALHGSSACLNIAGACFVVGILVFSGLLYALALGGPKILGAIVPLGGTAFIAGWVALAIAGVFVTKR